MIEKLIKKLIQTNKSDKMDFIDAIKKRVRNDWDIMIAITGEVGVGKSTLAQTLGFQLDEKFDQTKNIVYIPTPEAIIDTFNKIDRYSVFMVDEAMELFYKMDFMKDYQKALIRMYARERKQNKISLLCLPNFTDLTKQLRDKRVKIWIHIIDRGYGLIFAKSPSIFSDDVWYIRDSEKLFREHFRNKKAADIDPKDIQEFAEQLPTFWMDFRFDPLPPDKQKIYMDCVTRERDLYYKENKSISRDKEIQNFIIAKLYFGYKLTTTQIADVLLMNDALIAKSLQNTRAKGDLTIYNPIIEIGKSYQHKPKFSIPETIKSPTI